jgi:hypothetical protein
LIALEFRLANAHNTRQEGKNPTFLNCFRGDSMAEARNVNMKGNPMPLEGDEVQVGAAAPDFTLTGIDMKPVSLGDTSGVRIFSIVPSLDTPVCDAQTRGFLFTR